LEQDVTIEYSVGAVTFGELLRQLRRRVGLTQGALATEVGFSVAQISRLEKNERLPDPTMVFEKFLPALFLEEEPRLAQQLVILAAQARGEQPPRMVAEKRVRTVIREEYIEAEGVLPGLSLPLVGRAQEIETIGKRLMAAPGRLLTLVGPPGVGKTQLALAAAAKVQPLFADGVYFIPLAAVTDVAHVASTIAAGLDLAEHAQKAPRLRLLEQLRRKATLLVLDNFEQINDAAPLVAELLTNCAGLKILVTSQEPLRLRAEQRQQVHPLTPAAALALFMQRAHAINPDFVADEQTTAVITAIVLRLDCLPLALELVAAQLDLFSPQQILRRLTDQGLDLLNHGPRDLPPHQQTLRMAIQRTYILLSATEQRLLQLLALFAGGGTVDDVATIAATVALATPDQLVIDLRTLVRKSLVQVQKRQRHQRYQLLTTIRAYAVEQFAQTEEQATIHHAFAAHFLALVRRHKVEPNADLAIAKAKLEALEQEHDNLRAALSWSLANAPTLALELAVALGDFWEKRGHDYEARQWLVQALAANPEQSITRATALVRAADFARRQAAYTLAESWLREAELIYGAAKQQKDLAYTLRQAGWLAYDLHDKARTLDAFERSLALNRALADPAGVADLLLCLVHLLSGQPDQQQTVQAYLAESLAIYQSMEHSEGIVQVLQQQGEVEMAGGNYTVAQARFAEALTHWRALGAKWEIGWALAQVGEAAWLQNDPITAAACYREAYELFVQLKNKDGIAILHHHLAQVARRQGDLEQAKMDYLASLNLSLALENQHMVARALVGLGGVAAASGAMDQAAILFGVAQTILDQLSPFLAPADADELLDLINATRTDVGEVTFEQNWQLGQKMTLEEAIIVSNALL